MQISDVTSTELFGGSPARPLAIVRVTLDGEDGDAAERPAGAGSQVTVRVEGPAVTAPQAGVGTGPGPGQREDVEGGLERAQPDMPGAPVQVTVIAENPAAALRAERAATVSTGEPGWTMWMVSHFHYDPVWWSTQGQFTESRIFLPDADGRVLDQRVPLELVRQHAP